MADDIKHEQGSLELAMRGPFPKLYFNGMGVAVTGSDMTVVLQHNNVMVGLLTGSYETFKTLSKALDENIRNVEKRAGIEFKSAEDLAAKLAIQDAS